MNNKKNVVVLISILVGALILGAGIPLFIVNHNKNVEAKKLADEKNRGLGQYSEYPPLPWW